MSDEPMQHSSRSREYKIVIEHLIKHVGLLDEYERSELAALLATAESSILAKMAAQYATNHTATLSKS
jgi:hypothetical protein